MLLTGCSAANRVLEEVVEHHPRPARLAEPCGRHVDRRGQVLELGGTLGGDADVHVAAQDFHYDATAVRRRFEENPAVLRLSEDQAAQIRAELGEAVDALVTGLVRD